MFLCEFTFYFIIFIMCFCHWIEATQRFVVEDNVKPPIFGSHKFDPILQDFEVTVDSTTMPESEKTRNKEALRTNTSSSKILRVRYPYKVIPRNPAKTSTKGHQK